MLMAAGIIDGLQPVEVENQHCKSLAGSPRAPDRIVGGCNEATAVGDAGQRIGHGESSDSELCGHGFEHELVGLIVCIRLRRLDIEHADRFLRRFDRHAELRPNVVPHGVVARVEANVAEQHTVTVFGDPAGDSVADPQPVRPHISLVVLDESRPLALIAERVRYESGGLGIDKEDSRVLVGEGRFEESDDLLGHGRRPTQSPQVFRRRVDCGELLDMVVGVFRFHDGINAAPLLVDCLKIVWTKPGEHWCHVSLMQNSEYAGGDKPSPTEFIVGEGFIPSL